MNQQPQLNQPVYVIAPVSTNSLGLAGFIVSLVGWFTLGLLCPIGFVLSFFGLFRKPRGFAIAGTLMGLIGSVMMVIVVAIVMVTGMAAAFAGSMLYMALNDPDQVELVADMTEIMEVVERSRTQGRTPPAQLDRLGIHPEALLDPWGTPYVYGLKEGGLGYEVTSAGPDRILGNSDDVCCSKLDAVFGNYVHYESMATGTGGRIELKIGSRTITLDGDESGGMVQIDVGDRVIELIGGASGKGAMRVRRKVAETQPESVEDEAATTLPAS